MRRSASIRVLACSALALSLATVAGASAAEEAAATPAAAAAPAPAKHASEGGESDHAMHVGHLGVGYFGGFDVPYSDRSINAGTGTAVPSATLQMVGVRYWLNENMAIDGALGIGLASPSYSTKTNGTTTDVEQPSTFSFALKAGVPLAFYHGKHYTFLIEPQLMYGHSGTTLKGAGLNGADMTYSGQHLAIGASAGAEVSFGFIGLPMLGLDASVGLAFDWQKGNQTNKGNNDETNASVTTIATANLDQPWNIFRGNVSVFYYF
jgi:hypothetical protein